MKKILITGAGSFIGTSFEEYLNQWPDQYRVDTLDMLSDTWRDYDFSGYDSIFHVAGIAHSDVGHVSEEKKALYYKVNTELTIETAKKAKVSSVGQFVFMSSSIVYGDSAPIGKKKHITADTPVSPVNFYGDSKVQAEKGLREIEDQNFKVVVLRPPMIYGKGSKGNYPLLSKIAKKVLFFPKVDNERSMLYVGNLVEFVRLMIENEERGTFCPQNAEYTNTSEMVQTIAKASGKRVILLNGFTWLLKLMSHFTGLINKAFGSLTYDSSISEYQESYWIYSFEESIIVTENNKG